MNFGNIAKKTGIPEKLLERAHRATPVSFNEMMRGVTPNGMGFLQDLATARSQVDVENIYTRSGEHSLIKPFALVKWIELCETLPQVLRAFKSSPIDSAAELAAAQKALSFFQSEDF